MHGHTGHCADLTLAFVFWGDALFQPLMSQLHRCKLHNCCLAAGTAERWLQWACAVFIALGELLEYHRAGLLPLPCSSRGHPIPCTWVAPHRGGRRNVERRHSRVVSVGRHLQNSPFITAHELDEVTETDASAVPRLPAKDKRERPKEVNRRNGCDHTGILA